MYNVWYLVRLPGTLPCSQLKAYILMPLLGGLVAHGHSVYVISILVDLDGQVFTFQEENYFEHYFPKSEFVHS